MSMKKSEKASKVTEEWVLERFVDLIESDANWSTKVKGLELLGKYLSMFQESKKVDVTYKSLIAGASLDELRRLAGEPDMKYIGEAERIEE